MRSNIRDLISALNNLLRPRLYSVRHAARHNESYQYLLSHAVNVSLMSVRDQCKPTAAVFQGRGTRAVFQFYPENEHQSALIMSLATKAGFNGGLVVDYPNSVKAKK